MKDPRLILNTYDNMQSKRVLSLFDGLGGARLVMAQLGFTTPSDLTYWASEIDPYAKAVCSYNFPDVIQLGDVRGVRDILGVPPKLDLLIGGSPCQGFSSAGKGGQFKDPRSKLFYEYVRLKRELKPKYFLLENVRMKKSSMDVITKELGVEPIMINSALFTAQNRVRMYWTNIPVGELPPDRGVLLQDIIEKGFVDRDKSYCIDASYHKGGNLKSYYERHRRQLVFSYTITHDPVDDSTDTPFTTVVNHRKLSVTEVERLQGVPEGYTEKGTFHYKDGTSSLKQISNTQRYKMLGNGFTIPVITWILGHVFNKQKDETENS